MIVIIFDLFIECFENWLSIDYRWVYIVVLFIFEYVFFLVIIVIVYVKIGLDFNCLSFWWSVRIGRVINSLEN